MKWIKLFGLPIALGLIFYLIGNVLPIRLFNVPVDETPIRTNEYLSFVLGLIGTLVTFLAVVVALFKEDIRKMWENVSFAVEFSDPQITEKLDVEEVGTSDGSTTNYLKAFKYQTTIVINNEGKLAARGCEMYLEKLIFNSSEQIGSKTIDVPDVPIQWNEKGESKILVPPKGKRSVPIIEIISPKKQSLPDGKTVDEPPMLKIGSVENPSDFRNGQWIGTFVVYSENVEPYRFSVCVKWDGKWAQRLTEMKDGITIKIN